MGQGGEVLRRQGGVSRTPQRPRMMRRTITLQQVEANGACSRATVRLVPAAVTAIFVLSMPATPQPVMAAAGASFDCRRAGTPTEHAICRSEALSALDRDIAAVFRQRRGRSLAPQAVDANQRQWLAVRDACKDDAACLDKEMSARKSDLQEQVARFASVPTQDRTGFSGVYVHPFGRAEIEAVSETELDVSISAVERTAARWVCDFSGTGTIRGEAIVIEHRPEGDLAPVILTLRRKGDVLTVKEERSGQVDYCGHNGSVEGTYRRTKARTSPRSR
jgi:uncharacterized protein